MHLEQKSWDIPTQYLIFSWPPSAAIISIKIWKISQGKFISTQSSLCIMRFMCVSNGKINIFCRSENQPKIASFFFDIFFVEKNCRILKIIRQKNCRIRKPEKKGLECMVDTMLWEWIQYQSSNSFCNSPQNPECKLSILLNRWAFRKPWQSPNINYT